MSDTDKKILEATIKLKNQMSKPLQQVQKSLQTLEKKSKIAAKAIGGLQRIMSKVKPLMLKVKDKLSPVLNKIKGRIKQIVGKTWKAVVTVKDKASSILRSIKTKLAALGLGVAIKTTLDTTEASREFNRNQAVIAGAAAQGKYKTKDLQAMRKKMYGYTGDDMMATNAVSNLTGMGLSVKEMQKTLDAATAAWTKYGDSIPIESLTESINETAQVGKITGVLADALNWTTGQEEAFNKQLEHTRTVQQRAKLINDALMKSYGKSKQVYDEMTKPMREYYQSQFDVAKKENEIGEALAPVNTMINNTKVSLMNGLIPVIQDFTPKLLEFGEKVKNAFETFRKSEEANNLLQLFKTVFETVWNAAKAVIDAVSPTIKDIFTWIADHSEQIKGIVQKLGKIWNNVWGAVGPILKAAWKILEPILSSFLDALESVLWVAEKVSGALNGIVQGFKAVAEAFGRKDVQKALSNSNAGNGNNTYQATFGGTRAMGQSYVPRNNMLYNLHMGEAILSRRDADQWRKGKGNSPQIVNNFYGMTVREEADVEKVTAGIVRKINQQRIVMG